MKHIAVLGSTGSIGRNTLEVIRRFPDKFRVLALTTNARIDILAQQAGEFHPAFVGVRDIEAAHKLRKKLNPKVRVFTGEDGLNALVREKAIGRIVLAISGAAALPPLLTAIESRKDVALANKEALVMAGPIIMKEAQRKKVKIMPIDSEQSAIWQCLEGRERAALKNIYLTASGGPLRKTNKKELRKISPAQVLKHPRWKMGRKISVDSATLMNKGLELLEAMFLFGLPCEKIKILIHPEALIHSMVEFIDGVVLAQLSATDMRIPIQYALTYPERLRNTFSGIDFYKLKALHFEKPDFSKFPCLRLAYQVARQMGTAPAVLNAANEVSVEEFLKRKLDFVNIPKVIERVLAHHHNKPKPDLGDIRQADAWAREEARSVIAGLN